MSNTENQEKRTPGQFLAEARDECLKRTQEEGLSQSAIEALADFYTYLVELSAQADRESGYPVDAPGRVAQLQRELLDEKDNHIRDLVEHKKDLDRIIREQSKIL